MGGREGGGRSWLGISLEFWKMLFFFLGFLVVREIIIVINRDWREREERGGIGRISR